MIALRHVRVARLLAILAFGAPWLASVAFAQTVCPPTCAGQSLTTPNFSHADLTGVSFVGSTITGGVFIGAKLAGANFSNVTFTTDPTNPAQSNDFTLADLTNAKFIGVKFNAPTYLAYATLTCADFSNTNLTNGNAIFGDDPLIYDSSQNCRIKFQSATMSCEFIDQWRYFDLTKAILSACMDKLAGRTFDGALMGGVSLIGAVLDGTTFVGANVSLAVFDNASLQCAATASGGTQCVDFSNALMQGATLNGANLSGASLYRAFLSNNINGNITQAGALKQAHLKNVNLAFAELSGVNFQYANFYGSTPANPGGCATSASNSAGFTLGCASAQSANMTDTTFSNAYLYGVDFRSASILNVDFGQATLAGANFSGATIGTNSNGSATSFNRAYLQGTNLDLATLSQADLTDAFIDFRSGGNLLSINLDGTNHNQFACSMGSPCAPPSGQDVCVYVRMPVTTVPGGNTTITCPDSFAAGAAGCGVADPSGGNTRWKSRLAIGTPPDPGPPPGWYTNTATFTLQAPSATVCNNQGPTARVLDW